MPHLIILLPITQTGAFQSSSWFSVLILEYAALYGREEYCKGSEACVVGIPCS